MSAQTALFERHQTVQQWIVVDRHGERAGAFLPLTGAQVTRHLLRSHLGGEEVRERAGGFDILSGHGVFLRRLVMAPAPEPEVYPGTDFLP